MQSLVFIREAKDLIKEINMPILGKTLEEEMDHKKELQKRINALFSGLQNPTLPSAFNLRDAALSHNFTVSQAVLHRLQQFDTV